MTKPDLEKIARRKAERLELLQSSLERMLPQLEKPGALKVMVFGSLMDGDIHAGSDLDILAIMPRERSGREWSRLIYARIDRAVASDIMVFNADELDEEIEVDSFVRQIMKKGRTVLEKAG